MAKVEIERIEVIVREHLDADPFEKTMAELYGTKPKGSTVGVKISVGGEWYGQYMCFEQSTLSGSEVAESVNEQFKALLNEITKSNS